MQPVRIGPAKQLWLKWKALHLPWRRQFLVGLDLSGNTYWEFRVKGSGPNERWRRIVKYPRSTHYSDVKISPLWHQWLRYTRDEPPSVGEQKQDVLRQAQMKQLAAEADARWEAKPRVMDAPGDQKGQPVPSLQSGRGSKAPGALGETEKPKTRETEKPKTEEEDPWAAHRSSGPSEKWQPEAWTPTPGKK